MKILIIFIFIGSICSFGCSKNMGDYPSCSLEPETGPCKAAIKKYYYDKKDKKCKIFIWGGCAGFVPFETMEDCKIKCDCKGNWISNRYT